MLGGIKSRYSCNRERKGKIMSYEDDDDDIDGGDDGDGNN